MRYAIHVDMDAYFAAIEQRANPNLRGRPVIVGGAPGTRSAVASASYEARAFGVRAGMPTHEAQRLCPAGIFVTGNSAHYLHTSVRLYRLLERFSPRVEPASVDEAYLEIATTGDVRAIGRRIMACIESELQLTASLGISDSKYLAKVCSAFDKPRGMTVLRRADVPQKLWPRPLDVLFGVGEKTALRLRALGCATVGDVARTPVSVLDRELGVVGVTLHAMACGQDRWRVVTPDEAVDARSIGHEHTLERDVYDRSAIEALLSELSERVARRARRASMAGRRVVLKLRDPRFFTITHGRVLPHALDTAEDVFAVARVLLEESRFWERGVRLVGISLQMLVPSDAARQLRFTFAGRADQKSPVVDRIRAKYGEHAIGLARSLEAGRRLRHAGGPSFRPPEIE
ncbi:MAG TPA: DNA polymerase IV [Candidatus Krumholzibacteria bacterium]|nr:DNA polymerase IV [Candidatus Krumholzibacteria bacterium]